MRFREVGPPAVAASACRRGMKPSRPRCPVSEERVPASEAIPPLRVGPDAMSPEKPGFVLARSGEIARYARRPRSDMVPGQGAWPNSPEVRKQLRWNANGADPRTAYDEPASVRPRFSSTAGTVCSSSLMSLAHAPSGDVHVVGLHHLVEGDVAAPQHLPEAGDAGGDVEAFLRPARH